MVDFAGRTCPSGAQLGPGTPPSPCCTRLDSRLLLSNSKLRLSPPLHRCPASPRLGALISFPQFPPAYVSSICCRFSFSHSHSVTQEKLVIIGYQMFKSRYQMNRYFQRKRNVDSVDERVSNNVDVDEGVSNNVEFDVTKLPTDLGLRIPILDYNANIRDEVRRAYMLKEFGSWLEYSVEKDVAYCLYCYLFRTNSGKQGGGHSFRGHDESEDSLNPSNFLVQLQFLAAHNEVINAVTLGNAPHNCKFTSPDVQKDIANACAIKTINIIIKYVGGLLFYILVDESCDVSMKEQMSIVLRYVDNSGHINGCFIGIEHFTSTMALSLKAAIDKVFSRYNLSMSRLKGQGYDEASNMQDFIIEALEKGEILSGRILNQETTLQRSGDTRWSSHYNSLVSLLAMFSSVLDVLAMIVEDESCSCDQRSDATNLLELIQRFDFAFNLQLMRSVLGMSNELSKALQRKDQDIVNAMQLVRLCKRRLQIMRDEGWDSFLEERNSPEITNLHHYRVDLFYSVIDLQLQELNDRFSKVNTELLLCVACLCPQDSFSSFDKKSLIRLAELYPLDFSAVDDIVLSDQLETYILDMSSNKDFEGLNGLGDLAENTKLLEVKQMANITKLELTALDISRKNYLSRILDADIHLMSKGLGETIKEGNNESLQDHTKALIFLRHHLHDGLKIEYLTEKDLQAL
ncbi:uncharacterized protein LOC111376802 [Olea europaea var. sylvestris]|uniref:uncharacterized protein LOC111376802 n=1 Tax=Olea europaea var. sylvestris TaxID=158386 RepID=UPI000C1D264D|nr:uncharacterized protein LOC111376802 [Olea europaea var. sylvestris]